MRPDVDPDAGEKFGEDQRCVVRAQKIERAGIEFGDAWEDERAPRYFEVPRGRNIDVLREASEGFVQEISVASAEQHEPGGLRANALGEPLHESEKDRADDAV